MKDMYNLSLSGGMGAWRQKEFWDLDRLVQNRLHYLQVRIFLEQQKTLV